MSPWWLALGKRAVKYECASGSVVQLNKARVKLDDGQTVKVEVQQRLAPMGEASAMCVDHLDL